MRRVFAAIAVLCWAAAATAAPSESVVVASDDAAFRAALQDALAPAGIAIVAREHVPTPGIADLATASRTLADDAHATATVWLLATDSKLTLVTYDRGIDRLLVRAVPFALPLDTAKAAEAARMARTMLRALRVTPDTDLPPPHASDAPAVHALALPHETPAALLAAGLGLGMRAGGPASNLAWSASGAVTWRPDALGLALLATYAPGGQVATAPFTGVVHDDALALVGRVPWRLHDRWTVTPIAGAALHVVRLRGSLAGGGTASADRLDPAVRAGAIGAYTLDARADLALVVSADYLLERQRYEVDAMQVLDIPRVQVAVTLLLSLRVL